MKAIFGLGNPGKEYEKTRHNVGFLVLDELAKRYEGTFSSKRSLEAEIAELTIEGARVLLVKPQTFMNASGRTFSAICSKYPVTIKDVLVVYDDADLPFGDVRYKESGSSAGHHGMESILGSLPKGTAVARIRVGIGRPPHPDIPLEEFVLERWTDAEEKALPSVIACAAEAVLRKIASSPSAPRNDKDAV